MLALCVAYARNAFAAAVLIHNYASTQYHACAEHHAVLYCRRGRYNALTLYTHLTEYNDCAANMQTVAAADLQLHGCYYTALTLYTHLTLHNHGAASMWQQPTVLLAWLLHCSITVHRKLELSCNSSMLQQRT